MNDGAISLPKRSTQSSRVLIARYFLVGGASAAVDFTMFALIYSVLGWHWFLAASIGFVLATGFNYALSVYFVFTSGVRFARRHEIGLVFLVSAVGLAMNQFALWVGFRVIGIDIYLAKIMATGAVFFWNFGARRYFIFRQ
jgi:putative flippase GtrA